MPKEIVIMINEGPHFKSYTYCYRSWYLILLSSLNDVLQPVKCRGIIILFVRILVLIGDSGVIISWRNATVSCVTWLKFGLHIACTAAAWHIINFFFNTVIDAWTSNDGRNCLQCDKVCTYWIPTKLQRLLKFQHRTIFRCFGKPMTVVWHRPAVFHIGN